MERKESLGTLVQQATWGHQVSLKMLVFIPLTFIYSYNNFQVNQVNWDLLVNQESLDRQESKVWLFIVFELWEKIASILFIKIIYLGMQGPPGEKGDRGQPGIGVMGPPGADGLQG